MKKLTIFLNDKKLTDLLYAVLPIQKLLISKTLINENDLEEKDFILEASGKGDKMVKIPIMSEKFLGINELLTILKGKYLLKINEKYNKKGINFDFK